MVSRILVHRLIPFCVALTQSAICNSFGNVHSSRPVKGELTFSFEPFDVRVSNLELSLDPSDHLLEKAYLPVLLVNSYLHLPHLIYLGSSYHHF